MTKSKLNDSIEQEKLLILTKFLENAPFDRWSESNLKRSSESCGFNSGYLLLLFPNGLDDLTEYFHQLLNQQMTENFLAASPPSGISENIAHLIELKINLYNKYRKAIPMLLQHNLLPQNLYKSQQLLWQTCDQIWYLAGDRSTDYNYYTKRSLLGYVYTSSVLYWLSDESADYLETKKFIRLKIQEVLKLGKWKSSVFRFFKKLAE